MDDNLKFRDFSLAPEGPSFQIGTDVFRCYPEIPLDVMMDVAAIAQSKVEGIERLKQMLEIFGGVIVSEDYDTFVRRTKRGTKEEPNPDPIGMRHVRELLPWIMEVYGLRPSQASPASADGSSDADTSSTELASDEE